MDVTPKLRVGLEEEVFIVNELGFLARHSEAVVEGLLEVLRSDEELLTEARRRLIGLQ